MIVSKLLESGLGAPNNGSGFSENNPMGSTHQGRLAVHPVDVVAFGSSTRVPVLAARQLAPVPRLTLMFFPVRSVELMTYMVNLASLALKTSRIPFCWILKFPFTVVTGAVVVAVATCSNSPLSSRKLPNLMRFLVSAMG